MEPHVKNRLRRWRAQNGLTLQEVADLTGFSEAMVSRAERGERTFSPFARVRVARAPGVRVSDLFDAEVEPKEVSALAEAMNPARSQEGGGALEMS